MNEYGQEKKSVWDFLDGVVGVYKSIRDNEKQNTTPTRTQVGGLNTSVQQCENGFVFENGKCVKEQKSNLLLIGLGVALLGTATFFVVKKMRS